MNQWIRSAVLALAGLAPPAGAAASDAVSSEEILGELQVTMNGEEKTFYAAVMPEIGPSSTFKETESGRVLVEIYGFPDPNDLGGGSFFNLKFYTEPPAAGEPAKAAIGHPRYQAHVGFQPTADPAFPQYLDNDNVTKVTLSEFRIDGDSALISGAFESLLYRFDAWDEAAKVVADKVVVTGSMALEARRK